MKAKAEGGKLRDEVALIVSDIEMPRMDGLTLCRRIKQDELSSNVPVVLFSSLINDQMARKCRSVGADDFVAKPELAKLIRILDRTCLEAEAEPEAEPETAEP